MSNRIVLLIFTMTVAWAASSQCLAGEKVRSYRRVCKRPQTWELKIPATYSVDNRYFSIKNLGAERIEGVWLYREGMPDFSSVDNLLESVLTPDMDAQQKAETLYQVVKQYRYHDCPPMPDGEVWDPIKLMEVYGYGLCGDAASALAYLWQRAELKSRVWELTGHVVSEVSYRDEWHVYDPDHEQVYLTPEGAVASLEYLAAHPELVVEKTWPEVGRIFASKHNNRLREEEIKGEIHHLELSLRPTEQFIRFPRRGNKHFRSQGYLRIVPDAPRQLAQCHFVYSPLEDHSLASLRDEKSGGVFLIYERPLPYVCLGGSVEIAGEIHKPAASISILLGTEKTNLREIWSRDTQGEIAESISLDQWLYGEWGYRMRIIIHQEKPDSVRLKDFTVRTICQCSPLSYPGLQPGNNSIMLRFEGSGGHKVEVDYRVVLTRARDKE